MKGDTMKKTFWLLGSALLIFVLIIGYQNLFAMKSNEKIANTEYIVMGNVINSRIAMINNKDKIEQLEDLFNKASFNESSSKRDFPFLSISFHGKENTVSFYIDQSNIIESGDSKYVESEQITYDELNKIYRESLSE